VKTAVKSTPPEIHELKILVRTHCEISLTVCGLCGETKRVQLTGMGLYDGTVHLGDVCSSCLRVGKRGAAARTRSHAAELRKLALHAKSGPDNGTAAHFADWLGRYAEFLEELAGRLETMMEWIPRAGAKSSADKQEKA
jgi:hypothetical protein